MTADLNRLLAGHYRDWFAAITMPGVGPLPELLADEWRYTNYDGLVRDKESYLAHVGSVAEEATFEGPYDLEVRCYGDMALVLGGYRVSGLPGGRVLELRFTGMWVTHAGRWHCLAHHNSTVA